MRSYEGLNANLAKALERPTALAYAISAEWLARQGRLEEALAQMDRALALGANEADIHISRARILNATGRAAKAEEAVRLAMRLNPHYGPDYLRVLGQSLLHQERYREAAELVERAVTRQPDLNQNYVTLAIIYGHLGRANDADGAVKKYNEMMTKIAADFPTLTVQAVAYWWYGQIFAYDDAYRERLMDGLRKAGVPEGAGADIKYADLKRLIHASAGEYGVDGATRIDAAMAKALHERRVVFIDVREGVEFRSGHIPSAVNLEMTTGLSKESLSSLVGKDDEVVFSCFGKYCPYAAYACAKAVLWGFTRAHYFAGGFPAWKDAGYPVETTTP